jgi:hypothetical protein
MATAISAPRSAPSFPCCAPLSDMPTSINPTAGPTPALGRGSGLSGAWRTQAKPRQPCGGSSKFMTQTLAACGKMR